MRKPFLLGVFLIAPLLGALSCAELSSEDPADTVSGDVSDETNAERAVATPADTEGEVDIDALTAEPGSELSYLIGEPGGGGGGSYCRKKCDCECRCKHGKCRWDDCDRKKKCKKQCEGKKCGKHDDDDDNDDDHDEKH
jgi:hypothetical protein